MSATDNKPENSGAIDTAAVATLDGVVIDLTEDSPWDAWTGVYLEWHDTLDLGDGAFYAGLRAGVEGPVVELGCGDGRLFDEVRPDMGLDSSTKMLDRARLAHPDVDLRLADIRSFALDEPAAMIYAPLNLLHHLPSHEAQVATLRTIRDNTAPGGVFAFDGLRTTEEEMDRRNGQLLLRHRTADWAVTTTTLCTGPWAMEWHAIVDQFDAQGVVTQRRYLPTVPILPRPPEGWAEVAEETGWVVEEHWGWFDRQPLDVPTGWQVVVLRNP